MANDDLAGRLLAGEALLWTGRPGQGIRFSRRDWLMIPFSLFWGGFAFFWESTTMRMRAPGVFRLWGLPFVLMGLYLIVGRFVVDAWLRSKTLYALTNQRILIARSGWFGTFTALTLDRLFGMELAEQTNDRGTIRFGQPMPSWRQRGFASWTPALDPTPQFLAIDNAQSVFNEIQRAMSAR